MSSTRCASSDRPATSASSGSVQSISTTWTPTSSALAGRASSDASATIDRSVRPPDSATTARRNWGADVSATGVGSSAFSTTPDERVGHASGGSSRRVTIPPAVSAPASARRHRRQSSGLVLVASPVGDVRDDRVLAPDEHGLEPFRRSGCRAAGPTSGGRRTRGGRRSSSASPCPGGQARSRTSRYVTNGPTSARNGDSTTTSGTPGSWRSQRTRSASASSRSSVTNTARTTSVSSAAELDCLDHRPVDARDREHDPLPRDGAPGRRGRRGHSSRRRASYWRRMKNIDRRRGSGSAGSRARRRR